MDQEPRPNPVIRMLRQPIDAARQYHLRALRSDVVAGLTVAVVAIPQSMAYAEIAGVPLQYGLYTVIIQCLIGSLFNSQKYLSVGPINTQSLLVFATVAALVEPGTPGFLQLVIALTLIKGLMQMAFAGLRLGLLVRYVSQSVIVGFTAGAGVLIAAKQIKNLLSVSPVRPEEAGSAWPGLIGIFQGVGPVLEQARWPSLIVGLVALAVVIISRRIHRLAPGPLIAVVVSGLIVFLAGWQDPAAAQGPGQLFLVGELPQGLPGFQVPKITWEQAQALLAGAFALSLLGLMEAFSIGKTIASRTGQRISANQELLSQGLTNFISSFFQCIPGSGSFSRSALNYYAGAQTLYAGVFNSLFVTIIFLALAPLARFVPMASLAAILFVIAYGLVDWRYFRRIMHTSRADAAVCLATFVATLTVELDYAVFVGIALNIGLYLRRASQLHMQEMVRSAGGPFLERPVRDRSGRDAVRFLQLEGDLFFGVADELQDRLTDISASGVRVVVLRLKRTHSIDATVLSVLDQFIQNMNEQDRHVVLCGVKPELMQRMTGYGLVHTIGRENVFMTQFGVFTSAKMALARARQLIGQSIDADAIAQDDDEETEGWSYQI